MSRLWLPALVLLLSGGLPVLAQQGRLRVVEYNVENLFDTCHDAGADDYEFLPGAARGWNSSRYWKKLGDVARVLVAAGGDTPPDLVGLCEVENDSVVRHLCERTALRRLGYARIVTCSRDPRGLDLALLFQPGRLRLVGQESIDVSASVAGGRPTRDVLYAAFRLLSGDTLDVLLCHWPSRRGGSVAAMERRLGVARLVRQRADSLMALRRRPALLLMGDFNDESTDRSVAHELGARLLREGERPDSRALYVLTHGLAAPGGVSGTYKYAGRWNQLDQVVVSGHLLRRDFPLHTAGGACRLFAPAFLLEPDATHGGVKPRRTFLGPVYRGGYSDHLPLVVDFLYGY